MNYGSYGECPLKQQVAPGAGRRDMGALEAFATLGSPICDDNESVSCGCFEDLGMCFPVDLKIRRSSLWAWPHQVELLTAGFPPAGG